MDKLSFAKHHYKKIFAKYHEKFFWVILRKKNYYHQLNCYYYQIPDNIFLHFLFCFLRDLVDFLLLLNFIQKIFFQVLIFNGLKFILLLFTNYEIGVILLSLSLLIGLFIAELLIALLILIVL